METTVRNVSRYGNFHYLRNYTCDLNQIFVACCIRSWFELPPAKGAKSAIYDCLVLILFPKMCLSQQRCLLAIAAYCFTVVGLLICMSRS